MKRLIKKIAFDVSEKMVDTILSAINHEIESRLEQIEEGLEERQKNFHFSTDFAHYEGLLGGFDRGEYFAHLGASPIEEFAEYFGVRNKEEEGAIDKEFENREDEEGMHSEAWYDAWFKIRQKYYDKITDVFDKINSTINQKIQSNEKNVYNVKNLQITTPASREDENSLINFGFGMEFDYTYKDEHKEDLEYGSHNPKNFRND